MFMLGLDNEALRWIEMGSDGLRWECIVTQTSTRDISVLASRIRKNTNLQL